MSFPRYDTDTEKVMRDYSRTLSEKDRRRYAAVEAQKLPHGGIRYIAGLPGCSADTVSRGLAELASLAGGDPVAGRVRKKGGGRPKRSCSAPS